MTDIIDRLKRWKPFQQIVDANFAAGDLSTDLRDAIAEIERLRAGPPWHRFKDYEMPPYKPKYPVWVADAHKGIVAKGWIYDDLEKEDHFYIKWANSPPSKDFVITHFMTLYEAVPKPP